MYLGARRFAFSPWVWEFCSSVDEVFVLLSFVRNIFVVGLAPSHEASAKNGFEYGVCRGSREVREIAKKLREVFKYRKQKTLRNIVFKQESDDSERFGL